jgi:Spy/CpxP family protein refolding chaperone
MKRKIGILGRLATGLSAMALAAGLAGAPALAADHAGPGGGRMGGGLRHALASLDLSQDQKDKIKAIVAAERPAIQSLREGMREDASELKSLASAQPADPAAVGAAFLKVRSDREAMKAERQKVHAQIDAILTPDQRTKLDGYLSALKERRHGFRTGE